LRTSPDPQAAAAPGTFLASPVSGCFRLGGRRKTG
jgi:hypothetical protein